MSDRADLIGRKALVTGGTKGIGEAVVARLREARCDRPHDRPRAA